MDTNNYPDDLVYDALLESVNESEYEELNRMYGEPGVYIYEQMQDIQEYIYIISRNRELTKRYTIKYNWSTVTNLISFKVFDNTHMQHMAGLVHNLFFYTDVATAKNIARLHEIRAIVKELANEKTT